ncbi:phosphoribosylglycinamide formyltransferase [uncultured Flavobacterium sp.]|uniref:phosphoribosylglycinamide formyltransferase n=1 Tax=uncultured Flavobacterium sp. TaxID=165435 RepID=UPI0025F65BE3|nr:phosphoribosylglycinamide formyltransferase [uncultured Flavobacterium sp.]
MKNIILFASGGGSNARRIMEYFAGRQGYRVRALLTNNPNAGAIAIADSHNVPSVIFNRDELNDGTVLSEVKKYSPDIIVLAGFLWKFPTDIIKEYPHKVINIHPALLPNYGGKGMYGMNVHRAVHENRDKESGITVHYVNEHYDEGNVIFQKAIAIEECLSPEDVALKVLSLEHKHFPVVIEQLLK